MMERKKRFKNWRVKRQRKMLKLSQEDTDDDRNISDTPDPPSIDEVNISSSDRYVVHLKLVSGHNLAVRDITGTSDPYVKLKHDKYKARSSIVHRNLNPIWKEKFIFQTKDLSLPLSVRVYDHDIVSSDDFMGQGNIDLNKYQHSSGQESLTIKLTDPASITEELGYLRFQIRILPMTYEEQCAYQLQQQQSKGKRYPSHSWNSILTVTILSATDLPAMDSNGFSDPYCKFKLDSQKYKTKVQPKTLNPEWKEKFDMKLFDDQSRILYVEVWDRDFPAADDFIGECSIDLTEYEPEHQHNLKIQLEKSSGVLHLHLVITGLSCREEDIATSKVIMKLAQNGYKLTQFTRLSSLRDIGLLHITIDRAADLQSYKGSNLNSFVTVEVGNAHLRTQTITGTVDPIWNKTFSFSIKDIHDVVHIAVFSEKNGKEEQLGQVMIPLLTLEDGTSKTYILKGKRCLNRVPGTIIIRIDLVYNIIRAGFRTIQPRELSVLGEEEKFRWKVLLRNIQRIIDLINPIIQVRQFYREILSWQDPVRSTLAVIVFCVVCLLIEIWIVLLVVIIIFLVFYVTVYIRQDTLYIKEAYQRAALQATDLNSDCESDFSDLEDYVHTEKNPSEQKNWRQRFRQLQDILLTVQLVTGYITDLSERIRNLVYWTVPFLCWMAIVVLLLVMMLTYHVSLRFIILIWGLYKLTKKLWKPKHIPNNEILDFLSRAPTDLELLQWKELKVKKKKNN